MIKFQNVSKSYNAQTQAIDNVNFDVQDGEIAVIIGPSGCGKTTLLRMVNQLESITDGDILLNEESIKNLNAIEMRRKIGYVIQDNGLFPNMTLEKNVMIVPDLIGWDRTKKRKRFNYLMDLIGLNPDEYSKRYPHELSGGQQQRIGVARALAVDPPVMLMDEPFGALDPIMRTKLQEEFLKIQSEINKTILFVSHDIDEAITMGDKIALLHDGALMQFDPPKKILTHPKNSFVSDFFGQDRVLKSMSLHSVKKLSEVFSLGPILVSEDIKSINENTSLRTALSILLNQKSDQIVIEDNLGNNMGSLTLNLIEKFIHFEVKGNVETTADS